MHPRQQQLQPMHGKVTDKMKKDEMPRTENCNYLFLLSEVSHFAAQSLLHMQCRPQLAVAKDRTHTHCVKLSMATGVYIPLDIFLLNSRAENSS